MKEIKNTTLYSETNVKPFLRYYFFSRTKTTRVIMNILIIIVIINFFVTDTKSNIDYISFIICSLGIIELNTGLMPYLNYLKLKKKKDSILNSKIKYIFKERNFEVTTKKTEYIDYYTIYKVIETNNYYYIYINKSRAFIVDKKAMHENQLSILTNRLKENVSTYIIKDV